MEVHGSMLGAHTQGKTHRQNDTKTRTCTQGETHIEEAALRAASTKGGGRPPLWIPLYGSLHGYGFVSLGRPASDVSFCLWVSPWV